MRLQKSATHKKHNDFINEMIIREMTSKKFWFITHNFFFKRIIGCNPSMAVFITHGHCIVWWDSVKTRVWESVKTRAWCMSESHIIIGITCRIPT